MTPAPPDPDFPLLPPPPANLPGIDMATAWRFANGNFEHLVRMHDLFQTTHGSRFITNYLAHRANNDWIAATRSAHTFKTGARMIGATRLGTYAETLEHACRSESTAEASQAFDTICTELSTVLSSLNQFRSTTSLTVAPTTPPPSAAPDKGTS